MNESINFIDRYTEMLSPFSAHRIEIWGEVFATVEHAYQASRIRPGPEREAIKQAPSPMDAWREGQKWKNDPRLMVESFDKYATMEALFRAKLAQHPDVARALEETGERELIKVHPTDEYWGTGSTNHGQNQMGKLWMKLRAEQKNQVRYQISDLIPGHI